MKLYRGFTGMASDQARLQGLREYPGYIGWFTKNQVMGALRNGTKIVKVQSETNDANPVGTTGVVLGSLYQEEYGICYFVEWDSQPHIAVAIMAKKIERQ